MNYQYIQMPAAKSAKSKKSIIYKEDLLRIKEQFVIKPDKGLLIKK